ncbi:hypothetical protein C8R45DRAFT_923069 [Mycena sanguinolenta]|nr:hypothetical protein C8R45DRAFT_923069 [Mycena sanguinolenta]
MSNLVSRSPSSLPVTGADQPRAAEVRQPLMAPVQTVLTAFKASLDTVTSTEAESRKALNHLGWPLKVDHAPFMQKSLTLPRIMALRDQMQPADAESAVEANRTPEHEPKYCTISTNYPGPVRPAKSIFASRIEQRKKEATGKSGRKPNFLTDECVIAGKEIITRKDKTTGEEKYTWCIGCNRKAAGHDATRIKNHAFNCQKLQAECPALWALGDHCPPPARTPLFSSPSSVA